MSEISQRSVRILFDLQACQTPGSADRGVGRASYGLLSTVARMGAPRETYALVSSQTGPAPTWKGFPAGRVLTLPPLPEMAAKRDFAGGDHDRLDSLLYSSVAARANADIIHVSHVFEGYDERVPLPAFAGSPAGQVISATLHDLIPLRFPQHYFANPHFESWYRQRMQWMRQVDLLLAVSESSRQDAITLLGIAPEQVATIYWGVAEDFKPNPDLAAQRDVLRRYGATRQHTILYTGGDEYRKNLERAILGFAALPAGLRKDAQLLIVCGLEEHRRQMFQRIAREAGLDDSDVLLTGYVPFADLITLYSACTLFIFPSFYEGFGLPIIEAMACGAPVIGGDNSSIRELIARPECLFDAMDPASIAATMAGVLGNPQKLEELRHYGLKRAKDFTWEKTGQRAIAAFDDALRRKRAGGLAAARTGWLPRKRLAMLTPLPPSKSGIADYNAQFLPFLAEHFDIDVYVEGETSTDKTLNAAFRVFHERDFRANAASYDAILYEFGNSEFHAHMVALLDEFPGIVGLHDAYLSGMMGYLEFYMGENGRYGREMLNAHGSNARYYLAPARKNPDPIFNSMVDLPCIKYVLDRAVGLISHSPFNLETARRFHPEGWPGPFRIIPQLVVLPEAWAAERRAQARAALGVGPDDFVIATFGHVAWNKLGDRVLEAFLRSPLARDRRCHLIFAGELTKDDFGDRLAKQIDKTRLGGRIKVTGFLPESEYQTFLRCADIAIQLRTKSRGGTPRGVLDCLAHGLPVVVNDEASYRDYPNDVVLKLSQNPTIEDISAAFQSLRGDARQRASLAQRGRDYVREHHDPGSCAAQYAAAIHEFMERHGAAQARYYPELLAPLLSASDDPYGASHRVAEFLDARPFLSCQRPRLLIDVSHISNHDHKTGIQRVVREIVANACCRPHPGLDFVAVRRVGDQLFEASAWLAGLGVLLPHEQGETSQRLVTFRPGDQLLMLDSSWGEIEQFEPVFQRARQEGVPVTSVIYDLLPLRLPENFVSGGPKWFSGRVRRMVEASDRILCISRAVADDVLAYMRENGLGRRGMPVGYWHLGSDFDPGRESSPQQEDAFPEVPEPYCLMVGTIEPRKNHALALEAFERLWNEGLPLNLVIAGRFGWNTEQFMERLRTHPLLNRRLFFFEGASDAQIDHLYRHAKSVIFVSKGEGFGLPVIEAARYGTPVICSDIPVFREVAGDHATYASIDSPATLARDIAAWWARYEQGDCPQSSRIPVLTWAESLEMLLDVVVNNNWYQTRN